MFSSGQGFFFSLINIVALNAAHYIFLNFNSILKVSQTQKSGSRVCFCPLMYFCPLV